jgi:hypothetical protein
MMQGMESLRTGEIKAEVEEEEEEEVMVTTMTEITDMAVEVAEVEAVVVEEVTGIKEMEAGATTETTEIDTTTEGIEDMEITTHSYLESMMMALTGIGVPSTREGRDKTTITIHSLTTETFQCRKISSLSIKDLQLVMLQGLVPAPKRAREPKALLFT